MYLGFFSFFDLRALHVLELVIRLPRPPQRFSDIVHSSMADWTISLVLLRLTHEVGLGWLDCSICGASVRRVGVSGIMLPLSPVAHKNHRRLPMWLPRITE